MKTKALVMQITFLLIIFSAYAQKQPSTFAISAGISSAFYSTDDGGSSYSDNKAGLSAGASLRLFTGTHWAVNPGLFYVQKGGVESADGIKATTSLNYLEIPVNMFYSKRNRFFFGFGPSFAWGLSGKMKVENESVKLNFGNDAEDDLKPFEVGLNLMAGFQFENHLFIDLNINTGMNNLSNDDSFKFSNAYLGIRLGYTFTKKTKPQ